MPSKRRSAPSARRNLYRDVTESVITALEAGTVPWVRPWTATGKSASALRPDNASTGRPYSGINILLLWSALFDNGWTSSQWLTYRQARKLGGHVRRGERGTWIFYADRFVPKAERERAEREGTVAQSIPMLKSYTVFNVAQCDDLPEALTPDRDPPNGEDLADEARRLIQATGADIRHGGDRAFYRRRDDFIQMPPFSAFPEALDYLRTLLHELTHWTGHSERLDRQFGKRFADEAYAREELVAELGAAYLCASLGLEPTLQHASYINFWLDVLKRDHYAIFRAASLASRASDYLLAFRDEQHTPLAA